MPTLLFVTVLTLSALYAPQPLLPVISREFGVSAAAAASLISVSFIPLCLAPLVYGHILQALSPRRLLRISVALLAITQLLFFLAPSFSLLWILRLMQGLLIPANLTALMTLVAERSPAGKIQRAMAIYVSATIFGGFIGRALSGGVAGVLGWRYSFLLLALSLALAVVLLGRLREDRPLALARPRIGAFAEALRQPGFLRIYLAVFAMFLVFAAIMNFIPFRLTEISEHASEWRIGLMYSGYLMGMLSSLGAVSLAGRLGGEMRALRLGLALMALSLLTMALPSVAVLFVAMFLLCGGMFLAHATASGLLNRCAGEGKAVVNGLYVAFYYGGGVVGSYAPALLYRQAGWEVVIAALVLTALLAVWAAWGSAPQGPGSAGES